METLGYMHAFLRKKGLLKLTQEELKKGKENDQLSLNELSHLS